MNVNGKRVLVCGMARSGIAAAKLLLSLGAQVTITDTKPEADFGGALDELRAPGCVFALGQAADALIAGQDMMIISPGIAWAKPFVQSAIAQGVEVMGELELGARLTKGALVAITGTNGKTTTTTLVGELFRDGGHFQGGRRDGGRGEQLSVRGHQSVPPARGRGAQHHGGSYRPPRLDGCLYRDEAAHL